MDYISLLLFLAMHYLRPQEWASVFTALRPVQVLAAISLYAIYQREKPVRRKDLWSTPQDYMVTAYFVWTVFASPTPGDTFRAILPLIFFYFVGVLTLNSLQRLRTLLVVWAYSILAISVLAVASKFGFDPLDSLSLTEGTMKGRLSLNLSIFNNPNALGHAIVPVIPMLYYLLFWKRVFAKPLIIVIVIPITAIMMTLSKGAFISAAVTIFATLTFGRPRMVQITMAALALAFGGTVLYALPRMSELRSSKSDAAIQGRIDAFKFGLHQLEHLRFGHGLGNFAPNFFKYGPTREEKRTRMGQRNGQAALFVTYVQVHYSKAPHSAYVQNGADLGHVGLFLFIGILYTCLRSLVMAKTVNNEEELIRRTLFAVVVSYVISSWMVDFCYRATFFFFTAAISALHRHLRGEFTEEAPEQAEEEPQPAPALAWRSLQPVLPANPGGAAAVAIPRAEVTSAVTQLEVTPETTSKDQSALGEPALIGPPHGTMTWERLSWIDLAMTYLLTEGALKFWKYLIENM